MLSDCLLANERARTSRREKERAEKARGSSGREAGVYATATYAVVLLAGVSLAAAGFVNLVMRYGTSHANAAPSVAVQMPIPAAAPAFAPPTLAPARAREHVTHGETEVPAYSTYPSSPHRRTQENALPRARKLRGLSSADEGGMGRGKRGRSRPGRVGRGGRGARAGRGGRGGHAAQKAKALAALDAEALAPQPTPSNTSLPPLASDDVARLEGTGCTADDPGSCTERYVLLCMGGNDKYLAPREKGVVYAAVRRRFRAAGSVPLARLAWRVVPQRNGWVRLQHVMTGRWMRLVPPPSDVQWMVRAEVRPHKFGKETWFRLDSGGGDAIELVVGKASRPAHLKAHASGAYINYRGEDMIRGHGNAMRGGRWMAADRLPTTQLTVEVVSLAEMVKDGAQWAAQRAACFEPSSDAQGAADRARAGGTGWSEVCWKHYVEPTCNAIVRAHGAGGMLSHGGASLHHLLRVRTDHGTLDTHHSPLTTTTDHSPLISHGYDHSTLRCAGPVSTATSSSSPYHQLAHPRPTPPPPPPPPPPPTTAAAHMKAVTTPRLTARLLSTTRYSCWSRIGARR